MFKHVIFSVTRFAGFVAKTNSKYVLQNEAKESFIKPSTVRNFSLLNNHFPIIAPRVLFDNAPKPQINNISARTLTKYSIRKGKRKSVEAVVKRFYRLSWGGWIRTKVGRQKKLWKKNPPQKRRLRQHVFCNATQSWMLDKMVGPYWRKPRYYVDDPYEPYHSREEYQFSKIKPRPYFPPEESKL